CFFFQAEDGIRDFHVTGVQTCALPISSRGSNNGHFRPLLDPLGEDRRFTMESELKFLGAERQFLIKQARPYPMPAITIANDCRRSEERRVGKECRCTWRPDSSNKRQDE